MSKLRRIWLAIFSGVQLCGLLAMGLWSHAPNAAAFLWGTSLIALFPGNLAAAFVIEKLFWNSSLSSTKMLVMQLPLIVGINALLWFVVIGTIRKWFSRSGRGDVRQNRVARDRE